MRRIVLDTNVYVAAMLGPAGAGREVLRRCLLGIYEPLMGTALYNEYESVLTRTWLIEKCALTGTEREALFDAFLCVCSWTQVYYAWRPNLKDEADNHLIELAVAGAAEAIVTRNVRDFRETELRFPALRIVRPEDLIKE